ncbi:unnamed protein product [Litomosoides sigmodontis]|uniref:Uncharacterized protein n=1 Tax=Litomosoides sigmodontis TaxID=42156 RepID=A0A3P6S105_LITSI|nr:unnamed protein product [Litomosoides sigmodontis]
MNASIGGVSERAKDVAERKSENDLPSETVGASLAEETNDSRSNADPELPLQHGSKQVIIGTQPLPTALSSGDTTTESNEGSRKNPKERAKQLQDEGAQCCAEFGSFCISLFSSC